MGGQVVARRTWDQPAGAYGSEQPWNQGASDPWKESGRPSSVDAWEKDETVNHLVQEQQEAERQQQELQALLAENERSFDQARKAVSQASRDRGWGQPPQQRQTRFTNMFKDEGKSKPSLGNTSFYESAVWFKGEGSNSSSPSHGKGLHYSKNGHSRVSRGSFATARMHISLISILFQMGRIPYALQ